MWSKGIPKGRLSKVKGRLKEHGLDDVLSVIDWMATSHHSTAQYLRGESANGSTKYYKAETPWRPSNFQTYLDYAREDAPSSNAEGGLFKTAQGRQGAPRVLKGRDIWAEMNGQLWMSSPARVDFPRFAPGGPGRDLADTEEEHQRRLEALNHAGGWSRWCETRNDFQRSAFQRAFIAAYDAYRGGVA